MFQGKAKLFGSNQLTNIKSDLKTKIISEEKQFDHSDLFWQVPISGTVFGTLLNFKDEYEALASQMTEPPYNAPPQHPVLYIQPANTLNSHLRPVPLPANESSFEIGAGLGIVIGKAAINVPEETALNYIAGYTIVADYSIPHKDFYRPDIKNKVRDLSCVIGPWIIDKNEVDNPDELAITLTINGEIVETNNTKNLIRSVGKLLADVTDFMTLSKGDVLLVGTSKNKPIVNKGDNIVVEIEQVGRLENTIGGESE